MPDDPEEDWKKSFERRARIAQSRVRVIWTPHRPISEFALFWGRRPELEAIVDAVETPGQHAILYGDRGVGKSSLAQVAAIVLQSHKHRHTTYRCDSQSTFQSIAARLLEQLGIDPTRPQVSSTIATKAEGGIHVPIVKAGLEATRERTEITAATDPTLTPSLVASLVGSRKLAFVVDEVDAIPASSDRRQLAELIKHLSDIDSGVKILVVGIASSTAELLAGHPSVHRHLKEVHLDRMSGREVTALITGNALKSGISFPPTVVAEIVDLSAGFPYFAQLLGLKMAERAVADKRRHVLSADLEPALRLAVQDAEETLRSAHETAIRSAETRIYEWIILSAAAVDANEIMSADLRSRVSALAGRTVRQTEINNAFGRLVKADGSGVLTRLSKGVYRFTDPRMKVYARIAARIRRS